MKISALKQIIRECVRAEIKAMEKRIEKRLVEVAQTTQNSKQVIKEQKSYKSVNDIRRQITSNASSEYEGLARAPKKNIPTPDNPKAVLENGEKYVSGQNLMEWFNRTQSEDALAKHEQAKEKMQKTDEFVKDIIERKRI